MPIFVWLFGVAGLLFALQAFPLTGIYLMFAGAGFLTGILLMLALLALFVEALVGRVPRWLAAVPVAAMGGYYGLMAYEWSRLPAVPTELGLQRPAATFAFDPARHSLTQGGIDPNYLLARYDVPFVYDTGLGKRRVVDATRTCDMINYFGGNENRPGAAIGIKVRAIEQTFCFKVGDAVAPETGLISFVQTHDKPMVASLPAQVQTLTAMLDGVELGHASTVSVEMLRAFPAPFVGCGLISSSGSWQCVAAFQRDWIQIWPEWHSGYQSLANAAQVETDQIATLLSLTPRTAEEMAAMTRLP